MRDKAGNNLCGDSRVHSTLAAYSMFHTLIHLLTTNLITSRRNWEAGHVGEGDINSNSVIVVFVIVIIVCYTYCCTCK